MRSTGSDESVLIEPIYTSLPYPARDGQVINFLADDANGVVWRLRYRQKSASIYRWEFISGSDLVGAQASTNVSLPTTGAYTDFSDATPTIALPLAGDYMVTFGAEANHTGTNQGVTIAAVATGQAGGANGGAQVVAVVQSGTTNSALYAAYTRLRLTGISGTLKMQYFVGATGGSVQRRRLSALPIRVG